MAPGVTYEGRSAGKKPLYGLIIAMILLSPIGLLATGTAWREWGADEIKDIVGYVPNAFEHGFNFNAMMPDYAVNGMNEIIGYIISAVAGVAIILILFKIIGSVKKEKLSDSDNIGTSL